MSPPPTQIRIETFDGLRTFAAIAVVIHHTNVDVFRNWAVANLAVGVFFCLSGFLAYFILHQDFQRTGTVSYNYYLFRRAVRIWPAYLTVIAVAFIAGQDDFSPSQTYIVQLFTFTMNWDMAVLDQWTHKLLPQLWTIAVEEQFYVLAPLLFRVLRSRYWMHFAILVFISSNMAREAYILFADPVQGYRGGLYYLTYTYADTFVAGAVVAKLYCDGYRPSLPIQIISFWLAVGLLLLTARIWAPAVFAPYPSYAAFAYALPAPACALLLIAILPGNWTIVSWFLTLHGIRHVGRDLSYSIYLYHVLALSQIGALAQAHGFWQHNIAVIGLCVFYAQLSFYLIENPARRIAAMLSVREFFSRYPVAPAITLGMMAFGFAKLAITLL